MANRIDFGRRTTGWVGAAAVLMLLAACDAGSEVTAPTSVAGVEPRFAAVSENERFVDTPFLYVGDNPCTGDVVTLTGTLRIAYKTTVPQPGSVLAHVHSQFNGKGTGTLGDSYVGKDERLDTFNATPGETFTTTIVQNIAFIRKGPTGTILGDDFHLHSTIKFTAPSGAELPSVAFERTQAECRG